MHLATGVVVWTSFHGRGQLVWCHDTHEAGISVLHVREARIKYLCVMINTYLARGIGMAYQAVQVTEFETKCESAVSRRQGKNLPRHPRPRCHLALALLCLLHRPKQSLITAIASHGAYVDELHIQYTYSHLIRLLDIALEVGNTEWQVEEPSAIFVLSNGYLKLFKC